MAEELTTLDELPGLAAVLAGVVVQSSDQLLAGLLDRAANEAPGIVPHLQVLKAVSFNLHI